MIHELHVAGAGGGGELIPIADSGSFYSEWGFVSLLVCWFVGLLGGWFVRFLVGWVFVSPTIYTDNEDNNNIY